MRLQRYLAQGGIASRRACEELITAGRVRVNGRVVTELGTSVADGDRVEVSGRGAVRPLERRYVVVNKPIGVMTTMRDPQGRRTVASLLPPDVPYVVPVGRLDFATAGVMLMTNDGDLAHILTHPRFGVEKTYRAVVRGRLQPDAVRRLLAGVRLAGGRSQPAKLRVVATSSRSSTVDITIHEGKNKQVRRMFEATDHPVVALTRLRFGPITLGALPTGRWRDLTVRELAALRRIAQAAGTEPSE